MEPGGASGPSKGRERVRYDPDQKLLALAGVLAFVVGALFWALLGARFLARAGGSPEGLEAGSAALAVAGLAALFGLYGWGLRARMERGEPVTRLEVNVLTVAGVIPGVLVGFLAFLALRFKLEDPGLFHAAGEPDDAPPALR